PNRVGWDEARPRRCHDGLMWTPDRERRNGGSWKKGSPSPGGLQAMRPGIDLVMVTLLALISALGAGPSRVDGQADQPGGLALAQSYTPGKIPVVLIHGLGASPRSWSRMVTGLEADPLLREQYQFWTFGYATGAPLLYSAHLLRQDLRVARLRFDPD